jgi:hypothetical protein
MATIQCEEDAREAIVSVSFQINLPVPSLPDRFIFILKKNGAKKLSKNYNSQNYFLKKISFRFFRC